MKQLKHVLIATLMLLGASKSYAWLPCQPFCEGCASVDYGNLASKFSSDAVTASQNIMSMNQALAQSSQKVVTGQAAITATLTKGMIEIMNQGLDYNLTMSSSIGINEQLSEHLGEDDGGVSGNLYKSVKNNAIAQEVQKVALGDYNGKTGGSFTADIFGSRAIKYKEAEIAKELIEEATAKVYKAYNNSLVEGDGESASFDNNLIVVLEDLEEEVAEWMAKREELGSKDSANLGIAYLRSNIDDDLAKIIQRYQMYLISQKPLERYEDDYPPVGEEAEYEIKRRFHNAITDVINSALTSILAFRINSSDSEWIDDESGMKRDSNVEGDASLYEYFYSITAGRLESPTWVDSIARNNRVGLYREYAVLIAEEQAILHTLYERKKKYNELLAAANMIDIHQQYQDIHAESESLWQ